MTFAGGSIGVITGFFTTDTSLPGELLGTAGAKIGEIILGAVPTDVSMGSMGAALCVIGAAKTDLGSTVGTAPWGSTLGAAKADLGSTVDTAKADLGSTFEAAKTDLGSTVGTVTGATRVGFPGTGLVSKFSTTSVASSSVCSSTS